MYVAFAARLREELTALEQRLLELLDASQIEYVNPNSPNSGVVFLDAADWGWAGSDPHQTRLRLELRGSYSEWFTSFQSLVPNAPVDLQREIDEADGLIRRWLERDGTFDRSVPQSIEAAKDRLRKEVARLVAVVNVVGGNGAGSVIVIPDTNALIDWPEVEQYDEVLGTDEYRVCLLPTVTGELDALKSTAPRDLRDRVRKVSRRLAEYRRRGSLLRGVPLNGRRQLFAIGREPNREHAPDWLDLSVADDRIIAATLALQGQEPSSAVVLVTSDLGLQQKAELARLPTLEPPPHSGRWREAASSGSPPPPLSASLAPGFRANGSEVRVTANVSNDGNRTAHHVEVAARLGEVLLATGHVPILAAGAVDHVRLRIPRSLVDVNASAPALTGITVSASERRHLGGS